MTPKSRLYAMVRNWNKKPYERVSDGTHLRTYESANLSIETWKEIHPLDFEPVVDIKTKNSKFLNYLPLMECETTAVLRHLDEAILAATHWLNLAKPKPISIPIKTDWLLNEGLFHKLLDAIYNCHLPIGLLHLCLIDRAPLAERIRLQKSLTKLDRAGVLFQLRNFKGSEEDISLCQHLEFKELHLCMKLLDQAMVSDEYLEQLKGMVGHIHGIGSKTIVGPINLITEIELIKQIGVHYFFGAQAAPHMSKHQVSQLDIPLKIFKNKL